MGGDAEVAGELLVAVLGEDEAGGEEDRVRVGVGRAEHVDGAVVPAVGHDEPAQGTGPGGPGAPGDQERELLIASIDELSAEDRRHVAALVESLRNRSAPPADR